MCQCPSTGGKVEQAGVVVGMEAEVLVNADGQIPSWSRAVLTLSKGTKMLLWRGGGALLPGQCQLHPPEEAAAIGAAHVFWPAVFCNSWKAPRAAGKLILGAVLGFSPGSQKPLMRSSWSRAVALGLLLLASLQRFTPCAAHVGVVCLPGVGVSRKACWRPLQRQKRGWHCVACTVSERLVGSGGNQGQPKHVAFGSRWGGHTCIFTRTWNGKGAEGGVWGRASGGPTLTAITRASQPP